MYYFYPVTGGYGASGVPDIVACYKGKFIGIEVKADMKKNKPTALQQKNLREIDDNGGVALVIDAFNLDHLKEVLDELNSIS
jgi:Holliday junction resolvase